MPRRSSIFSSDTLREAPRPTAAFWTALALVGMAWAALRIGSGFFERIRGPSVLQEVRQIHEGLAREPRSPQVLFFGSSRFMTCILAPRFAARAGLGTNEAINLAVPAGDAWDAGVILRRNPELLDRARWAVIEVEPWMINLMFNATLPKGHFHRWASLRERRLTDSYEHRGVLMLELLWPLYERRPAVQWFTGLRALGSTYAEDRWPPARLMNDPDIAARAAADPTLRAAAIVPAHFRRPTPSPRAEQMLDELVASLQARGIRVALVVPPIRKEYMDYVLGKRRTVQFWDYFTGVLQQRERAGLPVFVWPTAADCGLDDSIFIDYGHYTREGAARFTDVLYDRVAPRFGLPPAATAP